MSNDTFPRHGLVAAAIAGSALVISGAGCELIVRPDLGLVSEDAAPCTICLDDADTVVDIDGDLEIVPKDAASDGSAADVGAGAADAKAD
jgi:hypothetical protein